MEKEVIGVKGVAGHWHMSFDGIFIESPMTKILSTTRILRVGFFYINLRRLRLDTVLLDTCPFHSYGGMKNQNLNLRDDLHSPHSESFFIFNSLFLVQYSTLYLENRQGCVRL